MNTEQRDSRLNILMRRIKKEADMATGAQLKAIRKYDAEHTKQIVLKLNLKSDADILERLSEVGNKQGYIKELIRQDINKK